MVFALATCLFLGYNNETIARNGQGITPGMIMLDVVNGSEYLLPLTAKNIGSFDEEVFVLNYNPSELTLVDLAAQTKNPSVASVGLVNGTEIEILSVDDGFVTLKVDRQIPAGQVWSGVLTIVKFKAVATTKSSVQFMPSGADIKKALYIEENTGDIGTIGRVLFDIAADSDFLAEDALLYDEDDFLDDYLKNNALVCDEDIDVEIYFSPKRTENAIVAGQNTYVFAVRFPGGETKEDISFSIKPIGGLIERNKVIIYGDINDDGFITTTDATLVTRWAGGNMATVLKNILAADVNGDAYITTTDATLITRRAGGNAATVFSIESRF